MIIRITQEEKNRLLSDTSGRIKFVQKPNGLNKFPGALLAIIDDDIELHGENG